MICKLIFVFSFFSALIVFAHSSADKDKNKYYRIAKPKKSNRKFKMSDTVRLKSVAVWESKNFKAFVSLDSFYRMEKHHLETMNTDSNYKKLIQKYFATLEQCIQKKDTFCLSDSLDQLYSIVMADARFYVLDCLRGSRAIFIRKKDGKRLKYIKAETTNPARRWGCQHITYYYKRKNDFLVKFTHCTSRF